VAGRLDSASPFGGWWKRDRLEFDSGGAETTHAGLIDGGLRLGLFRRCGVVWGGMRGRLGRAWTWQGRGLDDGRAEGLQREGKHSGGYEKSANVHVRDAGPLRDDPVLSERTLRVLRCGWLQRRPEPLLLTRSLIRGRNHANDRHVHLIECNADLN
jgi:hypothetical protein